MQRLRIALEWCRNPDHLPLIAVPGRLRAGGWEIDLVIADDHCDDFQALAPVRRGAATWRDLHTRGGDVAGETAFEAMFGPHGFSQPAIG